ncbi:aldehyde ferredoxin oxidoreductase C-terminal domain-containing protein [Acidobacteriota bacterium]
MSDRFGHTGFRLRIDLTERKTQKEEISKDYARKWMGGRGFNMEVFFREIPVDADPSGPENLLMFAVGPVTGTSWPGSRISVSGKSPHTGYLGDSNAGGHFGPEMKYAGYDQIVIQGKADRPVYISIADDKVKFKDATQIWNLDTWETNSAIRAENQDHTTQVACCGTGAVNGVSFGCVMTNNARAMGRTGMGTLMASKNLKAIAVSGTKPVRIAHPREYQNLVNHIFRKIYSHSNFQERGLTGTTNLIRLCQEVGILPTRHFQNGVFEDWVKVSGETIAVNYNVKRKACFGCVNPCSRYYLVPEGFEGEELRAEGPEYETLAGFSSRVGCSNLKIVLKCAELVNRAGIDSITVSEVISWAQEMYEMGLLKQKDCDGLDLTWGNSRAVYELLQKIIKNEGFGAALSQGVVKASGILGIGRELCMEAKNLEIFQADVRGLKAYGLGNAVASRGADHQRADPFFEMSGRTEEAKEKFGHENCGLMLPWKGKGKMVPWFEEICTLGDSLNFCKIIGVSMEIVQEPIARDLFRWSTGYEVDIEEVMRIAERITNLERAILVRYGLSRKDDYLPKRFIEEPLPEDSNQAAGLVFENEQLLAEYYAFRGWDSDSGWPTEKKLEELDLRYVIEDLKERGIALKHDYPRFEEDSFGTTTTRWADISKNLGDSPDGIYGLKKKQKSKPDRKTGHRKTQRLIIEPGLCTGCRACEMACSFGHEKVYSPLLARVHVVKLEEIGVDFPAVCLRCVNAPCAAACPLEAINQDPKTRLVKVNEDLCDGCGRCAAECVSGVIELHPINKHPLLCDLCSGDPECSKKCPTGAIITVEVKTYEEKGSLHGPAQKHLVNIKDTNKDSAKVKDTPPPTAETVATRIIEARKTREELARKAEKRLLKRWTPEGAKPVDTPMYPPDPETGEPIRPPLAYRGNPPPVFSYPKSEVRKMKVKDLDRNKI